ncbi:tryptophan-rich sensory protein [Prauserella sp. ASG 168]|uniref:Tryptophan-rich sensory protein n=1 Tax=Prauserella cavernicola TaxID=2800127 RepID=A0A934QYA0_9PSEU|nr:tryptophan-rich sensory protein [Prauserella cavernicola]
MHDHPRGLSRPVGTRSDLVRSGAVLLAMLLQIVAGALGGSGALGEPVGEVARAYPTLLLPAGTAFLIWSLIYVATFALAVRQVLPAQRGRDLHRASGWPLAVAGLLNAGWIALFTQRQYLAAEVVIVALLAVLALTWTRLSRIPAQGWADRLFVYTPVTIYTGWVLAAAVAGAATTAAAEGLAPSGQVATVLAALAVAATTAATLWVILRGQARAVAGFTLAVAWAIAWIAVATPAAAVSVVGGLAAAVLVGALLVRLARTARPAAAAAG